MRVKKPADWSVACRPEVIMPNQEQKQKRIAEVKEKIADLRKEKPRCSDHWENEFQLMELEDELADLMASEGEAEKE